MIATLLTELASALSPATLAASDDGGGAPWLLVLGPAGAGAVYFGLWRYYRNTHTSHDFERETRVEATAVTGHDSKVDDITGTRRSRIDGENHGNHRQRVQRVE
jgi:hypothetical protein